MTFVVNSHPIFAVCVCVCVLCVWGERGEKCVHLACDHVRYLVLGAFIPVCPSKKFLAKNLGQGNVLGQESWVKSWQDLVQDH